MHHSSDDEQIIFLLDLNIIEGQSNKVDDLIQRLVSNVRATEPDTLVYNYYSNEDGSDIFLYEVYKNHAAAEFHVDQFLQSDFMPEFVAIFEIESFEVLGSTTDELREKMINFTDDHRSIMKGFKR
jgi:quinol monooxygenase YgiN